MAEEMIISRMIEWLAEDIPFWDLTSSLIPHDYKCKAVIVARESGVAACTEEASKFLERVGLTVYLVKKSGEEFKEGDILLEIKGSLSKILEVERLVLNILSHTCGIATVTSQAVKRAKKVNPKVRIAATRKTLPGLRYFEKKAVESGGGDTHRFTLSDMILIKDNHLAFFRSIKQAIKYAKSRSGFTRKVEIEVSNPEQAVEAAEAGADIIMLDNFTAAEVATALKMLEERGLRSKVIVEVSGGIHLDNLEDYARLGVDVISIGALTHSVKAIDLSLEVVECRRE